MVRYTVFAAGFVLLALAGSTLDAQTNIMRAPGTWRGTLLEGTDALIATNKYGEPQFIAAQQTVGRPFAPSPLAGDRLADEFKRLCMDTGFDQLKMDAAVQASSFALTAKSFSFPARKSTGAFDAKVWISPEARVQIWQGNVAALDGFESLSRWRRGMTSSPFKAARAFVPSCNLTVMARDFHSPDAFLARMTQFLGKPGTKIVTKPEWADGYWSTEGPDGVETRITYSMVDLDKSEQLLHVAFATVPSKKKN